MTNKAKLTLLIIGALIVLAGAALFLKNPPAPSLASSKAPVSEHAEDGDDHDEGGELEMSETERQKNGVLTELVQLQILSDQVIVPGEITPDIYRTTQITPRIAAQVVTRHKKLGAKVKAGERLVTLSSVEMADAQGALIVANQEWQRVRKLGREVVSERRFIEAQVAAEQARAKVLAYGMTPEQATALAKENDASKATGTFELLAPQVGTVINDNFIVGEIIEPGREIFQITDESSVWIKAQLAPEQASYISVDTPVSVITGAEDPISGRVVQTYHAIDETTRTLPVRIVVDNAEDRLHPGQFVNVAITSDKGDQVLAVPEAAVILIDGNSTVFKVEGREMHPTAIDIGQRRSGWVEVRSGLVEGDEIAVSEVFLLKSLIQKSQMGEGHGH